MKVDKSINGLMLSSVSSIKQSSIRLTREYVCIHLAAQQDVENVHFTRQYSFSEVFLRHSVLRNFFQNLMSSNVTY